MLEKSKSIPLNHLEDVYITGLCASSCHLKRLNNKGFKANTVVLFKSQNIDKISDYNLEAHDVVIHYSTGQMDRLFLQNKEINLKFNVQK